MKYCPKCGKQIEGEIKYCPNCGYDTDVFSQITQENLQQQQRGFNQQGGYPTEAGKGMAIGSLICGLLALFIPGFGIITAILAIILGFAAKSKYAAEGQTNTGMATAGIVLGVIGVVIGIISFVAFFIVGDILLDLIRDMF